MTNNEKRIEDEDDCFHGVPESECCRCVVIKLEAKNKRLEKRVKKLERELEVRRRERLAFAQHHNEKCICGAII